MLLYQKINYKTNLPNQNKMQSACLQTIMRYRQNKVHQQLLLLEYTFYGLHQMFEKHFESHALNASKAINILTHKI